MGITTGEKPKFDLITASKTKKYKIVSAVVLVLGILLLVGSLLLRTTLTSAVTPNNLTITENSLSGLDGVGPRDYTCTISQDETFVLTTGTPQKRALADPIVFSLDDDAKLFLEVREKTNTEAISSANYQGLFYLHIRNNVPEFITDSTNGKVRPSGYLTITCASKVLHIKFTYLKDANV